MLCIGAMTMKSYRKDGRPVLDIYEKPLDERNPVVCIRKGHR